MSIPAMEIPMNEAALAVLRANQCLSVIIPATSSMELKDGLRLQARAHIFRDADFPFTEKYSSAEMFSILNYSSEKLKPLCSITLEPEYVKYAYLTRVEEYEWATNLGPKNIDDFLLYYECPPDVAVQVIFLVPCRYDLDELLYLIDE